jgi:hypothetical protein
VISVLKHSQSRRDCTFWINRSTGRLSVALESNAFTNLWVGDPFGASIPPEITPFNAVGQGEQIMDSLTFEQYLRYATGTYPKFTNGPAFATADKSGCDICFSLGGV